MATKRATVSSPSEKATFTPDPTRTDEGKSNISPAVPSSVIVTLLTFTFAMIFLPIGSYFVSVNTVFSGNSTYAGALAAVIANVVLIGYVIVAFQDDKREREEMGAEGKKVK